jgi:hypothetical protein
MRHITNIVKWGYTITAWVIFVPELDAAKWKFEHIASTPDERLYSDFDGILWR